jgi:two-component system, chemotaxis family, sensor kinase CheA
MESKLTFDIEADELEIFVDEVNEHLQTLDSGILLLEQAGDPDILNSVFRAAHTIKALAGTVGHHRMAELTHAMETIFDAMREGKITPTQTVADDVFATVDALKVMRDEILNQQASNIDSNAYLARLRAIIESDNGRQTSLPTAKTRSGPAQSKLSPEQLAKVTAYQETGHNIFEVEVNTTTDTFAAAARLSQAAMAMMELGEIVAQYPSLADLANGEHNHQVWALYASKAEIDKVETILGNVPDLAEFKVHPYQASTPEPVPPPATTPVAISNGSVGGELLADKTVRVNVERLDILMNLVGELVTDRNRLLQIEDTLRTHFGKDSVISELSEMTAHVGRVVDQLQEEVMRARMLPIARIFNKIPRLVRDVSRIAGKEVNLIIEGEDTELDRSLYGVYRRSFDPPIA